MTVAGRYNRLACAFVVLGVCAYATAAGSLGLALLAVPLVIAAWWFTGPPRRWALPRLAVNLLLTGVIGLAVYRVLRGVVSVDVIAELVLLILLVKMGDRRTARDDAQLLSMSIFLGIAAMLTSIDFWVGLQIIPMIPLLGAAVMLFQVHAGQEEAERERRAIGASAPPPPSRGLVRHLRALSFGSVAGTAAVAAMVFVLMPRGIGRDRFGNWGLAAGGNVTGFTDQVSLTGGGGVISQSPEVMLTLQVKTSSGVSLGSAETIHYLRGAVLDRYDGAVWVASATGSDRLSSLQAGEEWTLPGPGARTTLDQTVVLRSLGRREDYLFAAWRPVSVRFLTPGRIGLRSNSVLRAASEEPGRFEYVVSSALGESDGDAPAVRTPTPAVGGPIADLARRVVRDAGLEPDPALRPVAQEGQAARAIQDHLRTGYTYTLENAAAPAEEDPIEWFLFERRQGHCEVFAAAMTQMCRAVGINARLVAGYVAAEYNAAADQYIVRASNAHAWVEAELGQGRWRRYDPTPSEDLTRLHRPSIGVLGRMRQWLDAVKFAWERSIVSFDESTRSRVIGSDREGAGGLFSGIDRFLARVRAGGPRLLGRSLAAGALVFTVVAAIGGALILLARLLMGGAVLRPGPRWRRRAGARGAAARLTQVRFYDRLLEVLRKRGVGKPVWRPPLAHAGALAESDAPLGEAVASLASLYYRVRFGGRDLDEGEQRAAEQAVRELQTARKRHAQD